MEYNFDIEKIKYSSNFKTRIFELYKFLYFYFNNNRPQNFINYEKELTKFLPEIMSKMSFDDLLYIIPNYYQFCYTITLNQNYLVAQNKILKNLLNPFSKILISRLNELRIEPLKYNLNDDNYVIFCRHAITTGMYAPGSVIYSITSGLLKKQKKVVLVSLGNIDQRFVDLQKSNPSLILVKKKKDSTSYEQLITLRDICKTMRPVKVITEMPLNIGTALYYSKVSSKIMYWSPGFTHVPWFDNILLVPELVNKNLMKNKKYVEIPKSLNFELLNPKINLKHLNEFKNKYFISKSDFVIGTFSRYEKISKEYLDLVSKILSENSSRKIIISGTNDRSLAENKLKIFIARKQAIVLGFSDIHILGNCCNVFLDTIPFPCGSSAIEIMAKGKPVLSLQQTNLANYKKSRVSELILKDEEELIQVTKKLENDKQFYNNMSIRSLEVAKSYDNSLELANSIISI